MKDDSQDRFKCDFEACTDRAAFKSKAAMVLHLSRVHGLDVEPTKVGKHSDPDKKKPGEQVNEADEFILSKEIHGHVVDEDGLRYPAVLRRTGHLMVRRSFWDDWELTDLMFFPDIETEVVGDKPERTRRNDPPSNFFD